MLLAYSLKSSNKTVNVFLRLLSKQMRLVFKQFLNNTSHKNAIKTEMEKVH